MKLLLEKSPANTQEVVRGRTASSLSSLSYSHRVYLAEGIGTTKNEFSISYTFIFTSQTYVYDTLCQVMENLRG